MAAWLLVLAGCSFATDSPSDPSEDLLLETWRCASFHYVGSYEGRQLADFTGGEAVTRFSLASTDGLRVVLVADGVTPQVASATKDDRPDSDDAIIDDLPEGGILVFVESGAEGAVVTRESGTLVVQANASIVYSVTSGRRLFGPGSLPAELAVSSLAAIAQEDGAACDAPGDSESSGKR